MFDPDQQKTPQPRDVLQRGVWVCLLLINSDTVAVAEVVMVAATGVDEHEMVGGGGRGGGDGLEVNRGLRRGIRQAEFIKETELLTEVEVSVVGVVLRKV